jgi:predicted DNA-binding transcriptional regulator AlpA
VPARDPATALRAWRHAAGYTGTEAGALFGVSKSAIGWWETGRAAVPARVRRLLIREGWLLPAKLWTAWTAEHDAWLDAHSGRWPLPVLAAQLSAAFGIVRTESAVRSRLKKHGASALVANLLTCAQVAAYCGVAGRTPHLWCARGWLRLPAWSAQRPRNAPWAVPPATLRRFCDEHAAQLNPALMPPSPYRAIVVAAQRRDHWLSIPLASAYSGLSRHQLWRAIRAGRLPAVRQPTASRRGVAWAVRARDLETYRRGRAAA